MIPTKIWTAESNIGKELFDENEALQPMDLRYLDIPYVFCPSKEGSKFIDALVECPELEIFGLHSVQILIDSHHYYWKRVNLITIGLPMVVQLICFWYWSNIVISNIDEDLSRPARRNLTSSLMNNSIFRQSDENNRILSKQPKKR